MISIAWSGWPKLMVFKYLGCGKVNIELFVKKVDDLNLLPNSVVRSAFPEMVILHLLL